MTGRSGDEPARLAALHRLEVLDTPPEAQFDKIVGLVRTVLGVPIATVTLVDGDRQWFKAQHGMPVSQTPRDGSFCTHTVAARAPFLVEDAWLDPRVADSPLVTGKPFIRAYAGVPLLTPDGHAVGALCAIDTVPRRFTEIQVGVLASFANLVMDELELRQIAGTDQLTGAASRRAFLEAAAREIARCCRHDRPAALALLDVDHFKQVNDRFGHPAGDAVLRQLAERCFATLRPNDLLGRIGGEEFALLLPETGLGAALAATERLRVAIAAQPFTLPDGRSLTVTASFGVASLMTKEAPEAWLARADAGLYRAKQAGRNRSVAADGIAQAAQAA